MQEQETCSLEAPLTFHETEDDAPLLSTYQQQHKEEVEEEDAAVGQWRALVHRASSFQEAFLLKHRQSLEFLNPAQDSTLRRSSPQIAIFNLVATVCGGGVLSLPLAFARAGILPATFLMIFSALITDFAMYILCSCARRTGGKSYGSVARFAFGPGADLAAALSLVLLLCFILVAYMVLVKDIWSPFLLPLLVTITNKPLTIDASKYVLMAILLLCTPLLLKKDLHALRHTCYVGFLSLLLLSVALLRKAFTEDTTATRPKMRRVNWCADNWGDVIFAFPIIALSFFSIYNVLGVHSALVNPTRRRVKTVLHASVGICCFLFYLVAMGGYLSTCGDTLDNILLNFPLKSSCSIMLLGRLGYGVTLMFGMPMVALPCREAMLSIPALLREWKQQICVESNGVDTVKELSKHLSFTGSQLEPGGPYGTMISNDKSINALPDDVKLMVDQATETEALTTTTDMLSTTNSTTFTTNEDELEQEDGNSTMLHYLSTAAIVVACYVTAVAVPGVAIVWSICGSSMAILIGFFIPAACYLKIRAKKGYTPRSIGAQMLLAFSISSSIVCTANVVKDLSS